MKHIWGFFGFTKKKRKGAIIECSSSSENEDSKNDCDNHTSKKTRKICSTILESNEIVQLAVVSQEETLESKFKEAETRGLVVEIRDSEIEGTEHQTDCHRSQISSDIDIVQTWTTTPQQLLKERYEEAKHKGDVIEITSSDDEKEPQKLKPSNYRISQAPPQTQTNYRPNTPIQGSNNFGNPVSRKISFNTPLVWLYGVREKTAQYIRQSFKVTFVEELALKYHYHPEFRKSFRSTLESFYPKWSSWSKYVTKIEKDVKHCADKLSRGLPLHPRPERTTNEGYPNYSSIQEINNTNFSGPSFYVSQPHGIILPIFHHGVPNHQTSSKSTFYPRSAHKRGKG